MDGMKHVAAFLQKRAAGDSNKAGSEVIMNNCIHINLSYTTQYEFVKTGKIDYMMSQVGEENYSGLPS